MSLTNNFYFLATINNKNAILYFWFLRFRFRLENEKFFGDLIVLDPDPKLDPPTINADPRPSILYTSNYSK